MTAIINALVPNATNMSRLDHTHVLATFHQYKTTSPPQVKLGLVNTTCLALEVHAQLEEEIFYPPQSGKSATARRSRNAFPSMTKCAA
jgi:hypothetical protein